MAKSKSTAVGAGAGSAARRGGAAADREAGGGGRRGEPGAQLAGGGAIADAGGESQLRDVDRTAERFAQAVGERVEALGDDGGDHVAGGRRVDDDQEAAAAAGGKRQSGGACHQIGTAQVRVERLAPGARTRVPAPTARC